MNGKTDIKNFDEGDIAEVTFTLFVFKNIDFEKAPFQIEITSEGIFTWNESVSKEELHNYLNYNAPSILLSYIRSIVSMTTAYAGIPNFMIPLINFYK